MSKTQQLGKNMSPSKTKLGKFLRKCRIKLGLRQVEVGRLSMVKQSDYSHFETGRSKYLNPKQIKGLAKTLKCQEVELEILVPPQIETSESERWKMPRAECAGVDKRCRRSATNWDGTGISKRADLSLVSSLKTNIC